LEVDRSPLETVYRHIDGYKCIAKINGVGEKSFFYSDFGYVNAFSNAKSFVDSFFSDKKLQADIFLEE